MPPPGRGRTAPPHRARPPGGGGAAGAGVGGDRRHQTGRGVLPRLDGHGEAHSAQRLAGDRADGAEPSAGEPLGERPRVAAGAGLAVEQSGEAACRAGRREGEVVGRLHALGGFGELPRGDRLVDVQHVDHGATRAQRVRQYVARAARTRDEHPGACVDRGRGRNLPGQGLRQPLGDELVRHEVAREPVPLECGGRGRADGGDHRSGRHGPLLRTAGEITGEHPHRVGAREHDEPVGGQLAQRRLFVLAVAVERLAELLDPLPDLFLRVSKMKNGMSAALLETARHAAIAVHSMAGVADGYITPNGGGNGCQRVAKIVLPWHFQIE